MKATRPIPILLTLCIGVFLGACEQDSGGDGEILATVNGERIYQQDYENYLKMRQSQGQQPPQEGQGNEQILNEMIDRILLVQYAEKKKLDKRDDVHMMLKRGRENILARAMIGEELKEKPITDEEARKKYDEESANTPKKEYKVRHILYKTAEDAVEAIKKLKRKTSFAKLSKKDSVDVQSGNKGGDLGWVNQGLYTNYPQFFEAIINLKKGAISQKPVKTEFGFHVIKVEDSRPWAPAVRTSQNGYLPPFAKRAHQQPAEGTEGKSEYQNALNPYSRKHRTFAFC